jgi:ABC-type proline/glycine betaine transport system substrate-binding protein
MNWTLPRWAALGTMLLALAAAPACVNQPKVTVHHAELRGVSTWGLQTMIMLQVRNDNSYDVQIRNVNVNVTFGRGLNLPVQFSPNQWLPSNQTTMVAVPVTIPWTAIPQLVAETTGAYAIPYYVKGMADVTATRAFGIERDNYPVDEGGSIPRQMVVDAARSAIPLPVF